MAECYLHNRFKSYGSDKDLQEEFKSSLERCSNAGIDVSIISIGKEDNLMAQHQQIFPDTQKAQFIKNSHLYKIRLVSWFNDPSENASSTFSLQNIDLTPDPEVSPPMQTSANDQDMQQQKMLVQSVEQFIGLLANLPKKARMELIRAQLNSPAFTSEYKQILQIRAVEIGLISGADSIMDEIDSKSDESIPPIARISMATTAAATIASSKPFTRRQALILNQQQNQQNQSSANTLQITNFPPNTTTSPQPSILPGNASLPLATGRMVFRQSGQDLAFDFGAIPLANPRSTVDPTKVPNAAGLFCADWPPIMVVSSFLSMQSPLLGRAVPSAKLLEIRPLVTDNGASLTQASILRGLLSSKSVVGVVRLAHGLALLILARTSQLIGMVIRQSTPTQATNIVASAQPSLLRHEESFNPVQAHEPRGPRHNLADTVASQPAPSPESLALQRLHQKRRQNPQKNQTEDLLQNSDLKSDATVSPTFTATSSLINSTAEDEFSALFGHFSTPK